MSIDQLQWAALLIPVFLGCYALVRVLLLEQRLQTIPSHSDLSETNQRLARVETSLITLSANVEQLIRIMERTQ